MNQAADKAMIKRGASVISSCRFIVASAILCFAGDSLSAAADREPTPVNSAVLIFDRVTLEAAPRVVDRIAALGDGRVIFVVTVQCRLSEDLRPIELGLMKNRRRSWKSPRNFEPMTDELLAEYRGLLTRALRRAVEQDLDIAILPHYDPAGEVLEWRNFHDFDPRADVSGFTYEQCLIDSCIDAVKSVANKQTRIDFSLGGEMGRSFFAHAASYNELAAKVRAELAAWPLSVGISLNHNDVAGKHRPTAEQVKAIRRFVDDADFIGFSNYAPFEPPPTVEKFTGDCRRFLGALKEHGVTVPDDTPLHFSEIGLGGAPAKSGAVDIRRAAAEPWEGTASSRLGNPWRSEPMTRLRRAYHNALIEFLSVQPGPRRVEAAYFWSEGSWEPLGVDNPAFADPAIVNAIRDHNARAAARQTPPR